MAAQAVLGAEAGKSDLAAAGRGGLPFIFASGIGAARSGNEVMEPAQSHTQAG